MRTWCIALTVLLYLTCAVTAQLGQIPNWPPRSVAGGGLPGPAVDLPWATGSGFVGCTSATDCISVTRSTAETCEGAGTVVTSAAANTPCITSAGLQVFGAGTNLLTHSQDTTGWVGGTGATIASGATAPDGTSTAITITDNATSTTHSPLSNNLTFTSGTTYTTSVYLKKGTCAQTTNECNLAGLSAAATVSGAYLNVDVQNCAQVGGTSSLIAIKLTALANGWCHVYYSYVSNTASATTPLRIAMMASIPSNGGPNQTYAGAGSTMLFWGAQVQATASFLPYCPTTTASVTCNADTITSGGSNTALKTALEGAAVRVVLSTADFYTNTLGSLLGVSSGQMAIGVAQGYQAQTTWPSSVTLTSPGQRLRSGTNLFGFSANASGRALALNGQTLTSDSNGIAVSTAEFIGSTSTGIGYCNCIISRLRVWTTRNDSAILAATSNGNASTLFTSYTGAVANHTRISQVLLAPATATIAMSVSWHMATENLTTAPQIIIPNYYVPNTATPSEVGPGAAATGVTASIEWPLGTCTQLTVGSATSWSIADVSQAITDTGIALPQTLTAGSFFKIRIFRNNANGVVLNTGNSSFKSDANTGEVVHYGTSAITDQTTTCDAVTNTTGNYSFRPAAIIGPTRLPVICELGDSRVLGYQDTPSQQSNATGEHERWLLPNYSVLNMGAGGDQATKYIASHTNRQTYLAYCSAMVVNLGVNDVYTGTRTAAQIEADLQTIYGYVSNLRGGAGGPVWQTTIASKTTSTDSFTTTANQTIVSGGTTIDTVNGWIRANTAGIAGFFEVQSPAQTALTAAVWNANGFSTFGYTADGLHGSQFGELAIQNALGFKFLQ